jgi:uncharacterized membrane-anchored protein
MNKFFPSLLVLFFFSLCAFAQDTDTLAVDGEQLDPEFVQQMVDSLEKTLTYQTGSVKLDQGNATLIIPAGFEYLDAAQASRVLEDFWGNPPSQTSGMLVPTGGGVLQDTSWAFSIVWDEIGFVEDDDAEDIDYDELLTQMQKDGEQENLLRVQQGYGRVDMVGWASPPFYDSENKVLHWAQNLKFEGEPKNTLNYNVRILGRKGVMILNAIGSMDQVEMIKANIEPVLHSVKFDEGFAYSDFDESSGDKIAAYTIGGLVAGKVLAKVGVFALLLKFGKVILIAVAGAGAAIWKWLSGRKAKQQELLASNEQFKDPVQ